VSFAAIILSVASQRVFVSISLSLSPETFGYTRIPTNIRIT
jgi:hypothetical protein